MHTSAVSAATGIAFTVQWALLGWRHSMHMRVGESTLEKSCMGVGQILPTSVRWHKNITNSARKCHAWPRATIPHVRWK